MEWFMWKKVNKPRILFILIILASLVFGVIYFNGDIKELSKEIKIKQGEIAQLKKFEVEKIQAQEQIKSLQNELVWLDEKLPTYDYSGEFINELYEQVKNKELTVDNVNVNIYHQKDIYKTARLSITVNGSLKNIQDMINYLNSYKKKVSIKTFNLQARPDNTFSGSINADLYYLY